MAALPAVAGIAEHLAEGAVPPQVVEDTLLVEAILPVEDIPASP